MADRKLLFICEGLQDEPDFLKHMMLKVFPDISYKIYSYRTTIHTLASRLKNEYPDFDDGYHDIRLILRDNEKNQDLRDILSGSFSDIILAFDFEPHHDHPDFDTVRRMLAYFCDSTDMGKLYINYPMMQSYKHLKCLPDPDYINRKAFPRGYKELVGIESCMTDLQKYNYEIFIQIAIHNLIKIYNILRNLRLIPDSESYYKMDWVELFDRELEIYWNTDMVDVINTLCFFPVDYNPADFIERIRRHQ